jgi:hypothetical protein
MTIARTWIVATISAVAFVSLAEAQDLNPKNRQELKRADLTGTNMEVIISVVENQPGETIPRHIHHGEEAFYEVQRSKHRTGSRSLSTLWTRALRSTTPLRISDATFRAVLECGNVRYWQKADIPFCTAHVRYWG